MRDRDPLTGAPTVSAGTRSDPSASGDTGSLEANRGPQPSRSDPTAMAGQSQTGGNPIEQGKQAAEQAMDTAREKADQVAGQASGAVDQGMGRAAEGLDMAADLIRQRGAQAGGTGSGVQSSAAMVADKLDAASGYLRNKDSDQLISDLEAFVRRKPAESLLIAAGLGFVLSKILRR